MAELSGVEALQTEIEKSKDKLRGYNENIKKLTGRDPSRPGIRRFLSNEGTERDEDGYSNRTSRGRGRIFGLARRSLMEDTGPPSKRRVVGGAFSRLGPAPAAARRRDREDSPYEEELPNKLSVHSSVVATSREAKNRKEILQEQTNDKEGMQRNRRMFGLLLGTLNKFKTESKTLETKEVQRKKIEEKLEENAEKEKRKFKMETKLLMEEMHLEQSKISRLQQKMEMVQEHADREEEMNKLKNFIATKNKPRIFWRPRQMSAMLENKLKDSKKVVDSMLQEGSDRLEKEIKELMERESKREERIKMRLREDGLLEDEEREGEDGADVGNRNVVGGDRGRIGIEIKEEKDSQHSLAEKVNRHVEQRGSDDEDIEADKDHTKKTRRTVVVEKENGVSSESDDDDLLPKVNNTKQTANPEKCKDTHEKSRAKTPDNEGYSSSGSEDGEEKVRVKNDRRVAEKTREEKEGRMRRRRSLEDGGDQGEGRNEIREKSREKDSSSSRKERKEDRLRRKDASEEKDKSKRRKEEDKKSSKRDSKERDRLIKEQVRSSREIERTGKERREDKKDKESKKHDSRGGKSRKMSNGSSESDTEVTKQKEESKSKSKAYPRVEGREQTSETSNSRHLMNSARDEEEDAESGSEHNNSA